MLKVKVTVCPPQMILRWTINTRSMALWKEGCVALIEVCLIILFAGIQNDGTPYLVCCFPEVGITVGHSSKSEVRGCAHICKHNVQLTFL